MAVNFKFIFILFTFTTNLRSMSAIPLAQDLKGSKSSVIDNLEEYDNVILYRVKKGMVVVGTCPKGMVFYGNQCRTFDKHKRLLDEDYDDVGALSVSDDITVRYHDDTTTDEKYKKIVISSTTSITNTDYTQYNVIPLAEKTVLNNDKITERKTIQSLEDVYKTKSSANIDDDQLHRNQASNTENIYNAKAKARSTDSSFVIDNNVFSANNKAVEYHKSYVLTTEANYNYNTKGRTTVSNIDVDVSNDNSFTKKNTENHVTTAEANDNDKAKSRTTVSSIDDNNNSFTNTNEVKTRKNYVLTTEANYKYKTTVSRLGYINSTEKTNKLITAVVLICICTIVVSWFFSILYQRCKQRSEQAQDTALPLSENVNRNTSSNSSDSMLECNVPLMLD